MADKRKEYNDWLKANPNATKEEKDAKVAELQAKDKEEKEAPLKATQKNVAKASAATDAPLASKKDVSMASEDKAVQPVIKAEKKVNEAKMKDARKPENQIAVREAENTMTKADQATDTAVTESMEPEQFTSQVLSNPEIMNTDEGKVAQAAIETKDAAKLSEIADQETGGSALPGYYNEAGYWVPYEKAEVAKRTSMSKGMAIALTVISVALSAISGGMVPPINFVKLDDQKAYYDAVDKVNQDYAAVVNGTVAQRNTNKANVEGTEETLASAKSKPELYSRENTDAAARGTAAKGGNVSLEQTQMTADLQKQLQAADIDFKKYNLEQTKELAKLTAELDAKRLPMQIEACRKAGISDDDIAKFVQANGGKTTANRVLDYIGQGANAVGSIVGPVAQGVTAGATAGLFGGKSDKDVKTFDAKPVNTNMLRKAWGGRK